MSSAIANGALGVKNLNVTADTEEHCNCIFSCNLAPVNDSRILVTTYTLKTVNDQINRIILKRIVYDKCRHLQYIKGSIFFKIDIFLSKKGLINWCVVLIK